MVDFSIHYMENCVPMTLTSQFHPENSDKKIKHLFLAAEIPQGCAIEYVPYFYFEAKIDLADVRSGLRKTFGIYNAMEIAPSNLDGDLLWTKDMVLSVEPSDIQADIPSFAKLRTLPAHITSGVMTQLETHFLHYLMRYFEARVFRNFSLGLYSTCEESFREFLMRCVDTLKEPFRADLDVLHETYKRKLDQIKEKYLKAGVFEDSETSNKALQSKNVLHQMSERIADIFLRVEFCIDTPPIIERQDVPREIELEERLVALEGEACQSIMRLLNDYREKARNIDEYIIHPSLKDIHMVGDYILWMPAKAGRDD
jgi:hypothetical protein